MATVGLIGTLDTKEDEYLWLADEVRRLGATVLLVDVGGFSDSNYADVSSSEVAAAANVDLNNLRSARDRGAMMEAMAAGAAAIVKTLAASGEIHSVLALGGSGGSSVAAAAMQALPVGFPKLLVSTMASGDVRPYVGQTDISLMYSVVDIAGINSVSGRVFSNAAAAAAAMASEYARGQLSNVDAKSKSVIGLTMFGVTTPAADEARRYLEGLGYEVLVFHATGAGGQAMENLARSGFLAGVLDLTTTELADELVGGVLSAGPERLEAAGANGIPQVVSVGALDMVNFGPRDSIPADFSERRFFQHNPSVTLMRTTPEEMRTLGETIVSKLKRALGPSVVFLPLRGVSAIDVPEGVFYDPLADRMLFDALQRGLSGTDVRVVQLEAGINDEGFGAAMASALHQLIMSQNSTTE